MSGHGTTMHTHLGLRAAEAQLAALATADAITRSGHDATKRRTSQYAAKLLRAATPFAWNAETAAAVIDEADHLPPDARLTFDLLPEEARVCWWHFDPPMQYAPEEVPVSAKDRTKRMFTHIRGLVFGVVQFQEGHALLGVIFRDLEFEHDASRAVATHLVHIGAEGLINHPDISASGQAVLRFMAAGCRWLRQRVLTTSDEHIERHQRKRLARSGIEPLLSSIKVVTLRRPEPMPHGEGSRQHIEYSCQWNVAPHERRLRRKDGTTVTVPVRGYRKGPKDKPLKAPVLTVYEVKR